ncbi:hypothetical protein, partial [Hydrogenophaga sp.]|uniref:hypothetical protein n=1 Tax=Hydrogenophaga sp. TaxID=1904254 RepID=UPI003D0F11C6
QPDLDAAADRLRNGVGESAVVWRQGLRPCGAGCTAAEARWLGALLQGWPVPDALTQATACDDSCDLSTWLAHAVQQGLVVGVVDALAPSHTPTIEEAP